MGEENVDDIFADYETLISDTGNREDSSTGVQGVEEITASQNNPVVRRRIIRNPRPKLNADRLCGERGIPGIEKHFENVKFKGKGHETEDLNKLLSTLEHWAHRLFPSLKYAECLAHIEKLGKKKPVQVCAKKIRLGMPILDEDFVHDPDEDNDRHQSDGDDAHPQTDVEASVFDRLIEEHQRKAPMLSEYVDEREIHSPSFPAIPKAHQSFPEILPEDNDISEEQKNRIELNKRLATERRKARLAENSNLAAKFVEETTGYSPKPPVSLMCTNDINMEQSSLQKVTQEPSKNNYSEEFDHNAHSPVKNETYVDSVIVNITESSSLAEEDWPISNENVIEESIIYGAVKTGDLQKCTGELLPTCSKKNQVIDCDKLDEGIQQQLTEDQILSQLDDMEEEGIMEH